ncbi:MAG: aromatic amino acid lyase, partial [Flavobacteriaceae bacterium]|nr:aromatic amino acid lyase [Flavobacteriaceae bacterium]
MYTISSQPLSLSILNRIVSEQLQIKLSTEIKENIINCRKYLDKKISTSSDPVYGINTGFGSLCEVKIDSKNLAKLQKNLVLSHACGTGDLVPESIVKMMLLLKIKSLSSGYSGVQLATVERLVEFYNNDIIPLVYTQGSLGASGDLAPLAHLALPLLGEGLVRYNDTTLHASDVLDVFGWQSISLQSKEG